MTRRDILRALDLGKRNYLVLALIVLLIAYVAVFFCWSRLQFHTVKVVEHKRITYNSTSADAALSAVKTFSEDQTGTDKDLSLSFRMKVSAIENHNNIFQTAPGNTGVRMELAQPSTLALVVGSKATDGLKGFILTKSLELNRWYSVQLSISKEKRLKVLLDNTVVLDVADESLHYAISDLAIGTGFSKTRPFNGEVTQFKLSYGLYTPTRITGNVIAVAQTAILVLALVVLAIIVLCNRNYLLPSFVVLLGLYSVTCYYSDKVHYTPTVARAPHQEIQYNSAATDPVLSTPRVLQLDTGHAGNRGIEIAFRMRAFTIDTYNNLFQTAPGNTGIRMELAHPSTLALIVGSKNPGGLQGFVVTNALECNRWYSIQLSISKGKRLTLFLDGVKVIDTADESLDYDVSDVAVGTGFSKTRPFKGELSGFRLEPGPRAPVPVGVYGKITLLLLMTAALAGVIVQAGGRFKLHSLSAVQKTDLIGLFIVPGFAIAVFYHYVLGTSLHLGYPFDTFLFHPQDRFNDFFHMYSVNANLNPYFENYPIKSNYYPFANMVFYLFTLMPRWPSLAVFSAIFVLSLAYLNTINLHSDNRIRHVMNIFTFTFLTYPLLYTVDRGNIEGLLCVSLLLFFHFIARDRACIGSLFLAMAIAMKGYPALLLFFLLSERRFKEALVAVAAAGVLTAACLPFFREGLTANLHFVLSGFNQTNIVAFAKNNYVFTGLSLFSLIKVFFIETGLINSVDMARFMTVYVWSVVSLSAALTAYVIFVEKEPWKKVALLVAAMLLFPHISFDYKLMLLFIPMFLFIHSAEKSGCNLLYVVIFGLLLIPKAYYFLPNIVSNSRLLSISVLLNPLILSVMMCTIIAGGIRHRFGTVTGKA